MGQKSQTVEIRFKPRIAMFDRPLQRALLYSFLFHACLFGVFRIKCFDLNEQETTFNPVEVAIEDEAQEEKSLVTVTDVHSDEKMKMHAPTNKETHWVSQVPFDFDEFMDKAVFSTQESEVSASQEIIPDYFLSESLEFQEPLYPLKLHLSKSLSKLKLVEDGSSFFKLKDSGAHQGIYTLAARTYPIEYIVRVSEKTGAIVEWKRKKELIDKLLQAHADAFIQKLRFAPHELTDAHSKVRGKIIMVFECPGEELATMVREGAV